MNKEYKKRWVNALRSGKYTQQREGCLYNGEGHCCLGVLEEVVGNSFVHQYPYIDSMYVVEETDEGEFLSSRTSEEVGLPKNPYITLNPTINRLYLDILGKACPTPAVHLSTLNDMGVSFEQIADIIEENL